MFAASRIGFIFFVNRGWAPLPWLLLFLLLPERSPHFFLTGIGLLFMLLGEMTRIWAVGYAGGITRTRQMESGERLITVGPYCHVRNPLYIGNMLLYAGVGFLFGNLPLTAFALCFFMFQYHFIVEYEEGLLSKKFGEAYRQYALKVSRWVPLLSSKIQSQSLPFSLSEALISEKNTLVAIASVLCLWIFSL